MMRSYSLGNLYAGVPLREMMDQLIGEAQVSPRARRGQQDQGAMEAPINMYETDADLIVVLPMPGISPNDIEVDVMGTQLCVRTHARRDVPHDDAGSEGGAVGAGERGRRWVMHEFRIGPYERTAELPCAVDVDRTQATYEHGLLTLRMPRPQADRPRRISLSGMSQGQPSVSGSQGRMGGSQAQDDTSGRAGSQTAGCGSTGMSGGTGGASRGGTGGTSSGTMSGSTSGSTDAPLSGAQSETAGAHPRGSQNR